MSVVIPVVLSGGSGTRLWPLSREKYPKQLLPLVGDNSMLQETVARLNGLSGVAEPFLVCNEEHRFWLPSNFACSGCTVRFCWNPVGAIRRRP